jgi:Protein of unknown function (DUF3108)
MFHLLDMKFMICVFFKTARVIMLASFTFFLGTNAKAQIPALYTGLLPFGAYKFNPYAQLEYQLHGQTHGLNYNAQAQITWKATGQTYNAKFDIKMPLFLGTRTQLSEGQLSEQGLKPLVFTDRHRKSQTVLIDQEGGHVRLAEATSTIPLEKLHQDALSVFFQISGLLAGLAEPYPFSTTLKLPVLMAQTNEHWTFRLDSLDHLKLPLGDVAALKVQRLPRGPNDKQKLTVWFSPSLGFLPVRILIEEENRDQVDQRLLALRSSP